MKNYFKKWGVFSTLVVLSFLCLLFACQKTEYTSSKYNEKVQKFFQVKGKIKPEINRVINNLQLQNELTGFIKDLATKEGYPIWEKAKIQMRPTKNTLRNHARNLSDSNGTDTLIVIPLVLENTSFVNSLIAVKMNNDIEMKLYRGDEYKDFDYGNSAAELNAEEFALSMMMYDKELFGTSDFTITDPHLFDYAKENSLKQDTTLQYRIHIKDVTVQCGSSTIFVVNPFGVNCPLGQGCSWSYDIPIFCNYTYIIFDDDGNWNNSGGSSTGNNSGGGPSFGHFHDPVVVCLTNHTIANGLLACDDGQTLGWVDAYKDLTFEEKVKLDQMEYLDNLVDLQYGATPPNPCHGTKRSGNKNFHGTVEHWLIQIDYISRQNPWFGEREYIIPGAGANFGYGYVDIVNTATRAMYEIKPNTQIAQGLSEIDNYVNKANLNCPTYGIPWNKGSLTGYAITYLPNPNDLSGNTIMQAKAQFDGLIVYQFVPKNTSPVPIVMPVISQSVIHKIKNLLEKLRNFPALATNYEIALFLKQNQDVAQVIINAALTTGIAILVATIIEDIVTLGVGIADDVASFILAHRLITIATLI